MSKVQLQGNVSGTGVFTIASPNSNTDRTLTLPDNTGTILTSASTINIPAIGFQAHVGSSYTISNGVLTIVQANSESYDTNGWYNTGNYRFTPQKAGYYLFTVQCDIEVGNSASIRTSLYKNGNSAFLTYSIQMNGANSAAQNSTYVAYANGSTDYFEFYCAATTVNAPGVRAGSNITFWSGTFLGT